MKKLTRFLISFVALATLLLAACTSTSAADPPATLQAAVAGTILLQNTNIHDITVLQEKSIDGGQLLLYTWTNEAQQLCLSAAYLTPLNDQWQTHDTLSAGCTSDAAFVAAYTGTSEIESSFGSLRHTTAYGRSTYGHAVRIVWADGQVTHVPLENGSFLQTRSGRWTVERIELLDSNNNLLAIEEWQNTVAR